MKPFLAILELGDFAIIALIVFVFAGGASVMARQRISLRRLEDKLDALLKHHGS